MLEEEGKYKIVFHFRRLKEQRVGHEWLARVASVGSLAELNCKQIRCILTTTRVTVGGRNDVNIKRNHRHAILPVSQSARRKVESKRGDERKG